MTQHDMPAPVFNPMPPWHMWGNTVTATVETPPAGAGALVGGANVQLFKIAYRRPETWSFFIAGRLLTGNVSDVDIQVIAQINLMPGVGRTMFDTLGVFGASTAFVEFRWLVVAGVLPGTGNVRKWTTQADTPLLDDLTATSRQLIQWIPAQDIQAQFRLALVLTAPSLVTNSATVEITAWMAPRTHIRPDWFSDEDQTQFLGSETGGT